MGRTDSHNQTSLIKSGWFDSLPVQIGDAYKLPNYGGNFAYAKQTSSPTNI